MVELKLTTFSQHAIALAVHSEECVQAFITSELRLLDPWLPPSASSQVAAPGWQEHVFIRHENRSSLD